MDVSIIIPVYNAEKYLVQCLDSIINQTIRSREIIIINDGSTDKSLQIILRYKKRYPELIVINQENKGVSASRNVGIKRASGQFIGFVDSDDFIERSMFKKMYSRVKREDSDIAICNYILFDVSHGQQIITEFNEESNLDKLESLKKFLLNDIKAYSCNKLFKRELFTKNKIFFPNYKLCEDTAVVFLLLAHANKISIIKEPLYYYRQQAVSLTKTFSIKAIKDMLAGCYMMSDYITKDPQLKEKLFSFYRVYMIKTLWVIHNKYFMYSADRAVGNRYFNFKKIVEKDIKDLKISEIVGNSKLSLKYKMKALLIKTRTYGTVFSFIYKFRTNSN